MTMPELSLLSAVLIGWLGGVHCLGMCGGIVSALALSAPQSGRTKILLAYNLGRCLTYVALGLVAGAFGYLGTRTLGVAPNLLYTLANVLLVGMGLYLLGFPWLVRPLEQLGQNLWRRIEPVSRQLFPVNTMPRALGVGLLWGFLPCGLVYSALATAFALGSVAQGGLWMAAFALGTLPNLLMAGWVGAGALQRLRQSSLRWIGGVLVAAWGVYGLIQLVISWRS
ncbi:MAG: sulfite exporter TauE/SafE family protein [Fluviibacter sp.]